MYKSTDKMNILMSSADTNLQIISRFGLPLGVEDLTIDEVCHRHNIDTTTFLSVINHDPEQEVDVPTLMIYLTPSRHCGPLARFGRGKAGQAPFQGGCRGGRRRLDDRGAQRSSARFVRRRAEPQTRAI